MFKSEKICVVLILLLLRFNVITCYASGNGIVIDYIDLETSPSLYERLMNNIGSIIALLTYLIGFWRVLAILNDKVSDEYAQFSEKRIAMLLMSFFTTGIFLLIAIFCTAIMIIETPSSCAYIFGYRPFWLFVFPFILWVIAFQNRFNERRCKAFIIISQLSSLIIFFFLAIIGCQLFFSIIEFIVCFIFELILLFTDKEPLIDEIEDDDESEMVLQRISWKRRMVFITSLIPNLLIIGIEVYYLSIYVPLGCFPLLLEPWNPLTIWGSGIFFWIMANKNRYKDKLCRLYLTVNQLPVLIISIFIILSSLSPTWTEGIVFGLALLVYFIVEMILLHADKKPVLYCIDENNECKNEEEEY